MPTNDSDQAYDVFISYSSKDRAWVRRELLPRLEASGLRVCVDFRDFEPGAPSVKEMKRGVETSRKTLLVLTPDYLASAWTEFEALMLQTLDPANRQRRLIPLLKAKCDLPLEIGFLTYIDFVEPEDWEIAWTRLLTALGAPLRREDWGEATDVGAFYGRKEELAELERWILTDRCRLVAILGMGGIGKTSLVVKLAEQIKDQFDYLFWRDLRNAPPVEDILGDCIKFLSDQQKTDLPESVDGKITLLIEYLRKQRCLLVLDNAEAILRGGNRAGQYRDGYEDYGRLIQRVEETAHQSCLVLTSREKLKELAPLEGEKSPVRSRELIGLRQIEGRELLKDKGLFGAEEAWTDLIDRYAGNPLALKQVSATVQELFGGDIAKFLDQGTAIFGDIRDLLDQQFDRLSEPEKDIMYWLAIEREAVSMEDLLEDIVRTIAQRELLEALGSLRRRSLIETSAALFTLQPVVMEYMIDRLIEQVYQEIRAEAIAFFMSHALIKAQAQDYLRNSQVRLILKPIADKLIATFSKKGVEDKLAGILSTLREESSLTPGYAGGNALNLFVQLKSNLRGRDFSNLIVWQAYLQGVDLQDVNFANTDLARSVFTENFGFVLSVTLSPDGKLLAAGTVDAQIRLWQVADGKQLLTCEGHTDWVWLVAFSPDGRTLASGSSDQTIRLWDVSTGQCLKTLQGHTNRVWAVAFSPDGYILASSSEDETVRLWDASTGQCLRTLQGHTNQVWSVAFRPDGRMLASGSDDETIRLWEVSTGQCLNTLHGHTSWVRSVAFSPDGYMLASGSDDRTIMLWDVNTGQHLKVLQGHISLVWSVAFSPDGRMLASGSDDQTVRLWDASSGQCLKTLQGYTSRVYSVAFSPDGRTLASGSDDQVIGLWDVNIGQSLNALRGHTSWVREVAFSPDGGTLASGSSDQTVRLWDVSSGQCLKTLQGHTNLVRSVAFNPDGSTLASGSDDQTVRLWDVSSGQCLNTLHGHTNWVRSVAFSPDGRMLASGSDDRTIRLWGVGIDQCLKTLQGHTNRVRSVTWGPNSRMLASGSDDQTVRLWDASSGQCLKTLRGHTNRVRAVAFGPDGRMLASGSDDQTVRLWDVSSGQCLKVLQGHSNQVWSVAFSPDGHILASGSDDETVRLWDIPTGECLSTLIPNRPYERMNITGVTGLTEAQKVTLKALGAVEDALEG
jgi:WD40 repeat protein